MTDKLPPIKWPADEVTRRSVSDLIPYARNARTHSDEQVQQIARSMREWGWTNPVLLDEDGMIIAGHGRILAAKTLGYEEAPCMVARGWSEAKKRAYIIADNKLALNAGWDIGLLASELDDLSLDGYDHAIVGFSEDDMADLSDALNARTDMPDLNADDRAPFIQVTFTLHDDQAGAVREALKRAKALGPFIDTGNENSNGNALARICRMFMEARHDEDQPG